jgi:TolA-binding protein
MSELMNTDAEVGIEQQALELMRRERPQFEDEVRATARRARLMPDLIQYVESGPKRRQQRAVTLYGSGFALAAAAAVALWVSPTLFNSESNLTALSNQGDFLLLRGEQQETVHAGAATQLHELDQLRTPATNGATLTLPTGSNVQVNESSAVQIAQINAGSYETLRLLGGSVKVHVPKLKTGEYFAVLTDTSKVVVHGTRFTVDVGQRATPGTTCVMVDEGLVAVHTAEQVHWVGVGENWGCKTSEAKLDDAPTAPAVAEAEQPEAPAGATQRNVGSTSSEQREIASLAEQNRLFQRALTHQRREEWAGAREAYEELLKRYPGAPLAAEARVQLRKIRDKISAEPR